jgi:hypothetical protein
MNRKRILLFGALVIIGGAVYYFYGGSSTPKGQPPLVRLREENFSSLKDAFNQSADYVRIVVMLSPT